MSQPINRYGSLRPSEPKVSHKRQSFVYHKSMDQNLSKSEYDKMCEKINDIAVSVAESVLKEDKEIDIHEALKLDPTKEKK